MEGSKLLKIVSILMIVFGAISLILDIVAIAGAAWAFALAAELGISVGGYIFAIILLIVATIIQIVAGILGVMNWNKPAKAQTCFIIGIICIALTVIGNIIAVASYEANVFTLISGLVIPILYVVGALDLKKKANVQ